MTEQEVIKVIKSKIALLATESDCEDFSESKEVLIGRLLALRDVLKDIESSSKQNEPKTKWVKIERNEDGGLTDKTIEMMAESLPFVAFSVFGGEVDIVLVRDLGQATPTPDTWELHHSYYTHFAPIEYPEDMAFEKCGTDIEDIYKEDCQGKYKKI